MLGILLGRGVTFLVYVMLAIFGLFAMALTAAFVIDPSSPEEEILADGVSDLDDEPFMGQATPVHELLEAQNAASSAGGMEGTFFDLRDMVDVTAFGTDAAEQFAGSPGDDYLSGRGGDDQMFGFAGNDEMHGELGDDLIDGGDGDDSLFGHTGDDFLQGGTGADTLTGGDGADTLLGEADNDCLSGNLGNDTLFGGDGQDVLFGGQGADTLDGQDDEQDFLNGGSGDDLILAGVKDIVNTGEGNDVVSVVDGAEAHVSDFDPLADQIELEYEGNIPPVLSTTTTDSGIALLADGALVMTLDGVNTLDVGQIKLIPLDT